jgi:voltage-gated potassium channel
MIVRVKVFRKFIKLLLLIVLILSAGTIGYVIIEGWGYFDSFYMTLITMTTVGFGEVHELSDPGRVFTVFLIVTCFGLFAFTVSAITAYIIGGEYKSDLRILILSKKMKKMKDHVIICGYGRVGKQVSEEMLLFNKPHLVLEIDEALIKQYEADSQVPFINGDATKEGILENVGIENANAIVTCLPRDADNIYVVLAAREINKTINIISRASSLASVSKLKLAGANHVIMPDSIGGSHMASLINNPEVIEFIDAIRIQGKQGVNMESIGYENLNPIHEPMKICDLQSKYSTKVKVVGYKSPDGEYMINPDGNILIKPESKLIVLGTTEEIDLLNKLMINKR